MVTSEDIEIVSNKLGGGGANNKYSIIIRGSDVFGSNLVDTGKYPLCVTSSWSPFGIELNFHGFLTSLAMVDPITLYITVLFTSKEIFPGSDWSVAAGHSLSYKHWRIFVLMVTDQSEQSSFSTDVNKTKRYIVIGIPTKRDSKYAESIDNCNFRCLNILTEKFSHTSFLCFSWDEESEYRIPRYF